MKIGVDLDEILSDTLTTLLEFYNNLYKTSFKKEDFYTYSYWEIWGGTREDSINLINKYYETNNPTDIKTIKRSFEAVSKLKELGHELHIITGRSESFKERTETWLNKHYPNIFSSINYANTFNADENEKFKSDICKNIGVEIFIEDDPYHIQKCSDAGIKVLFIDYPWNKNKEFKNATRVYSWDEIVKYIENFK